MNNILTRLQNAVGSHRVLINEPMCKHTTFRVGGPADYFVSVESVKEISSVLQVCREEKLPYYIIGNGSNLLVGDKGYRGLILQIAKEMNHVSADGDILSVEAGALLSKIGNFALEQELAGFEFASGIPGTIGGGIVMNAGAYGGELKDVLLDVTLLNQEGEVKTLSAKQLELGYRTSIVAREGYVVLSARIQLKRGDKAEIKALMDELKERRVTKQPLEYPSAGSTFKRPEGYFAGKLIQDAGLRGYQIGGAQVSEKHCGFVINAGEASALDILKLMEEVQRIVEEKFGVTLEPEVKRLGEF